MTPSRNHLSLFALLAMSLGVIACVVSGGAVPTTTSLPPSPTQAPSSLPTQTATTPPPTATSLPPIIDEANIFDLTAIHTLSGHGNSVQALAFSPDGETLVVSTGGSSNRQEHRLRLWDVSAGDLIASSEEFDAIAWDVIFSPDGGLLAAGVAEAGNGMVYIWDAAKQTIIRSF